MLKSLISDFNQLIYHFNWLKEKPSKGRWSLPRTDKVLKGHIKSSKDDEALKWF